MTDDEIERLIDDFVAAARLAQRAGFDFVDLKHCHGYLGHEFLSAVDRPGPLRRQLREPHALPARDRGRHPGRRRRAWASACASAPSTSCPSGPGPSGTGEPEPCRRRAATAYAFGGDGTGAGHRPDASRSASSTCWPSWASSWSASPAAAPTTTRTSSARRSSRPPTATSRPRTRWPAWRARSG